MAPLAMSYWEEVGAVQWTIIDGLADYHSEVSGALSSGRYLTGAPVSVGSLGKHRHALRTSPYFRMGTTYADLFEKGRRVTALDDPDDAAHLAPNGGTVVADTTADTTAAVPQTLTFGTGLRAPASSPVSSTAAVSSRCCCAIGSPR